MTDYSIHYTPQFERELNSIYYYLYNNFCSPQAADNFYSKVKLFISHLDLFPERYSKVSISKKSHCHNLRKMPVDNYIIIYEVDMNLHKVSVIHIFNGRQNYLDKI